MAVFSYKGVDEKGREVEGIVEAPNRSAAYSLLKKRGIFSYELKEEGASSKRSALELSFGATLTSQELILILRTLSALLSAGIPVVDAAESMAASERSKKARLFLKKLSASLKEGKSLAESFKEAGVKDRIVIALIKSGEKSALLPENLLTASSILERREKVKGEIIQALLYPFAIVLVAVGVVVFMLSVIIPKIVAVYESAKLSLPASTRFLISLSNFLRENYFLILLSFFASILFLLWFSKKRRELLDRWKLKIPVLGPLLLKLELGRFLETFGRLVGAGIPAVEALETASETLNNLYLRKRLSQVGMRLKEGASLSRELGGIELFPPAALQLVASGESSGALDRASLEAAKYLESEAEYTLKRLTSLLEPAIMLVVGVIVGFIVYSLLLPIVSISVVQGF